MAELTSGGLVVDDQWVDWPAFQSHASAGSRAPMQHSASDATKTNDPEPPGKQIVAAVSEATDPQDALRCMASLARDHPSVFLALVGDKDWLSKVVAVAGASQPLGNLLAQWPDALAALDNGERIESAIVADQVALAVAASVDPTTQAAGVAAIRRAATAAIASRDLTGEADVATVAAELAALAEGVLTGALRGVHAHIVGDNKPAARLAVIGMGKLGGIELNYVSDVDVMFVHEPLGDDERAGEEARATFTKMMEVLNASTTMGRTYEVDPTLRPEGRSGPLSRTVASYIAYWERWAKTWEFQALIKARTVAGDHELGDALLTAAEPFVWPEQLDPEVVAEIRGMKARIEAQPAVVRDGERQIKLGPGGLRDIEFTVQLLQLVHGRGDRSLRRTGTLPALDALVAAGYVDPEDADEFAEGYRLLRTVEHRLQLAHERRTHTVPSDPKRQEWLARAMGYRPQGDTSAREQFMKSLARTQGQVSALHAKIFYRPLLESYASLPAAAAEVSVPGQVKAMGDSAARERFEALGFRDGQAALRNVRALTGGLTRKARTVRAVLPTVLHILQDTPDPDQGLAAFRNLLEAQSESSELLGYLRDHPNAAELLGLVLGTSPVAGDLLAEQPQGLEWLREPSQRTDSRTREALVRMAMGRLSWQDTTAALRRLKRSELLRMILRDLADEATVGGLGEELTALAEACLEAALASELHAAASRHNVGNVADLPVRVAIIGMGKLGGRELQYASDLDVLFVHEPVVDGSGTDAKEATALALEIVGNVMKTLSTITADGSAFDVDADLRPEGRSGPLSRSLASYETYWERWAEAWEHQALIKVRHAAGDSEVGARFVEQARRYAYGMDDVEVGSLHEREIAMRRMKARLEKERIPRRVPVERHLKLGPGGMSDVEWTVQLLQQRHGSSQPMVRSASTMEALDALQDAELITHRDATWLREGHHFASQLRNRLYLLRQRDVDVMPDNPQRLEILARSLGYGRGGWQQLEDDWRRHARRVRQACERVFYGIEPSIDTRAW
ncbi:MAG: bifunctional [glutamine synthetase] adenylyltransferase/[glutamine synthetase]-adenylyl-L-tyrosine phosphorylase [Nitriliruptoraceae bacterium]